MDMRLTTPCIACAALLVGACTSKTLEIESNTTWSGAIGGDATSTIDGRGSRSIGIPSSGIYCWDLQKQTQEGSLRVYAKVKTVTSSERDGDATTTAEYGVVSGCTGG